MRPARLGIIQKRQQGGLVIAFEDGGILGEIYHRFQHVAGPVTAIDVIAEKHQPWLAPVLGDPVVVFRELCHSPDYTDTCPEDLMHTCLGVPDIIGYCDELEQGGIEIWPGGWKEKFSSGERKMAFVTDPDGYEVEILERGAPLDLDS